MFILSLGHSYIEDSCTTLAQQGSALRVFVDKI